ncbi:hypothetical protein DFAR_2010003 [Desulfarculales bacterium]
MVQGRLTLDTLMTFFTYMQIFFRPVRDLSTGSKEVGHGFHLKKDTSPAGVRGNAAPAP